MKVNTEQRSVGVHEDLADDLLSRGANQLNQKNRNYLATRLASRLVWRFDYVGSMQQKEWVAPGGREGSY